MPNLPKIDQAYLTKTLTDLLNTPSPTGHCSEIIEAVQGLLTELSLQSRITPKGMLIAEFDGEHNDSPRALTAHVDTLGAMVKEIKPNGRLKLSALGGFAWNTVEGEGCTVLTADGPVRGSILLTKASAHIYSDEIAKTERNDDALEVRIDARSTSSEQTREIGVEVGDFVAFDPRLESGPAGFIRSRHLDDKAGVACLLAAVQALHASGQAPKQTTTIHISNYEEVGHGAAAGFPANLQELIAVDMAVVGEGQESDEFHVTICVKDRGGPYHHGLTQRLRELAKDHNIQHKVDIYPYYGSDGEALWRAGGDVQVALIGPGVDASHNYERTHTDALITTSQLICAYLLS